MVPMAGAKVARQAKLCRIRRVIPQSSSVTGCFSRNWRAHPNRGADDKLDCTYPVDRSSFAVADTHAVENVATRFACSALLAGSTSRGSRSP